MGNRLETEQKLIDATGSVLARDGFTRLGINAIAREAGVDKVLIYRYFENLDGLIRAYAHQGDFWPTIDELIAEPLEDFQKRDGADQLAIIYENHAAGIRRRPLTLQILAWEMVDRNELTAHLETVRETQGHRLIDMLISIEEREALNVDVFALTAIFTASINYLAARSLKIRRFNGIEITRDDGWDRLTKTIRALCENAV